MLRNEKLIGEIYGLGKPRKQSLVSIDYICSFLGGTYNGLDHLNYFCKHFTAIPYVAVEESLKLISDDSKWLLCKELGMVVSVYRCDPRIFVLEIEKDFMCQNCCLIVCSVPETFAAFRKKLTLAQRG